MTVIDDMLDTEVKALIDNIMRLMLSRKARVSVTHEIKYVLISPLSGLQKYLETVIEFDAKKVEFYNNKIYIYLDDKLSHDIKVEFYDKAKVYVNFKTIELPNLSVETEYSYVRLKTTKELTQQAVNS